MKPYYGATNSDNKWWDGKDWRSLRKDQKNHTFDISSDDWMRMIETLREHDKNNCHVDGVFRCARCRRQHFIPDNFDYLCDGCVSLLQTHPATPANIMEGIATWRAKDRQDPDIIERYAERQRLLEE